MKKIFFFSESRDGWMNLAVDEHLLNTLGSDEAALLLYINEGAVIIGKNQNPWRECHLAALDADSIQLVRRFSGGGAVYHDTGNLNFSFIAGEGLYDERAQTELILSVVRSFGIDAAFTGRNDLTAGGRKFSGNAYCSRSGKRLQHGTLLINTDFSNLAQYLSVPQQKLESKGVTSVRSRVCNLSEFSPDLTVQKAAAALEAAWGAPQTFNMTLEDEEAIRCLYERNASWEWCLGGSPSFDYAFDGRFAWGGYEIRLAVKDGIISEVTFYTDALDPELPQLVKNCLLGTRFNTEEMAKRLINAQTPLYFRDLSEALHNWEI